MSSNFQEIFTENLNRLLKETGSSQKNLAIYVGTSPVTVNDWIKGRKVPRAANIDKICKYFGVEQEKLLKHQINSSSDLSKREIAILKTYRSLDEEKQNTVYDLLNTLTATVPVTV